MFSHVANSWNVLNAPRLQPLAHRLEQLAVALEDPRVRLPRSNCPTQNLLRAPRAAREQLRFDILENLLY